MTYYRLEIIFIAHSNIYSAWKIFLHCDNGNTLSFSRLVNSYNQIFIFDKFQLHDDGTDIQMTTQIDQFELAVIPVLIPDGSLRKTKSQNKKSLFLTFFFQLSYEVAVLFLIKHSTHECDQPFLIIHKQASSHKN